MSGGNNPHLKSHSFDFTNPILIDKEVAKSFSFAVRTSNDFDNDVETTPCQTRVKEDDSNVAVVAVVDQELSLEQLSEEIHLLIVSLSDKTLDIALDGVVANFLEKLESRIGEYEDSFVSFGNYAEGDACFIEAVTRLSCLVDAIVKLESSTTMPVLNRASSVIFRAMVFMEDELRCLLEETADSNKNQHEAGGDQADSCVLQDRKSKSKTESESEPEPESTTITFTTFSAQCVTNVRRITSAMITCGYQFECCNVFTVMRRHAFEAELKKQGFEKHSADDIQKMSWETLQTEMETWIRAFKHISSHLLVGERDFYNSVLAGENQSIGDRLFTELSSAVLSLFVNFVEAVSMTKRSTEKLFKFLDVYEALTQTIGGDRTIYSDKESRSELSMSMGRLGEAAVSIFCMLENSIKSDVAKTPVPNGAVHPLTRYTMNYLKYACEYKHTLEQIFRERLKNEDYDNDDDNNNNNDNPFAVQLTLVMELLDANLDAKSRLYKDPSLRYIFQMNNGRYKLKKVKETPEIRQVLGDKWCREKSSKVRQCHKGYQRESWTRVLQCLNPEGLQVNGKIYKPTLKERFKQFNQLFEEIHKTQSTWVVSDEQLQSELRVSISAVMIPAYRSFVSRFGQIFTAGRQTVKYVKYQPDDIEGAIEELFDGNPNSMARRRA